MEVEFFDLFYNPVFFRRDFHISNVKCWIFFFKNIWSKWVSINSLKITRNDDKKLSETVSMIMDELKCCNSPCLFFQTILLELKGLIGLIEVFNLLKFNRLSVSSYVLIVFIYLSGFYRLSVRGLLTFGYLVIYFKGDLEVTFNLSL